MGKRGPQPAPTDLKLIRGDRKSRVNNDAPIPDLEDVSPPAWLYPAALALWNEYAPRLEAKGCLTSWDLQTFAGWCDAVARREEAAQHLVDEGVTVESDVLDRNGKKTGNVRRVQNIWWQIWKDANEIAARIGTRFGLSPSERSQLKIGAGEPADGKSKERLLS